MQTLETKAILDGLEALNKKIDQYIAKDEAPYSSIDCKELFKAMALAQGDYKPVGYNRENPYFKSQYADLDSIIRAVRPSLSKNGLSFMQQIRITDEGATILHSMLCHASGQWIESRMRIVPLKNDAQTFGSTLTYQKRYAAISLLGITVSHDLSDDDAEVAMVETRDIMAKGPALNTKYNAKEQSYETITKEQLDQIEYELAEYPDIGEQILSGLQLQSLADLPKSKFQATIKRIREITYGRKNAK